MRQKTNKTPINFRLTPDLSAWLAKASAKLGKTKTRLVEEGLTLLRAKLNTK